MKALFAMRSIRQTLFLAHLLVIAVGVVTMISVTILVGPRLHDRLMHAMMDSHVVLFDDPLMVEMTRATTLTFTAAVMQALLLAGSAATLAAVAVSLFASARIMAPLQRLLRASRSIANGHYAERVPVSGNDELSALAVQFNTMASALEDAEQRRVALIGDVAHELRTPLATIEGYAEGLLDGVVAPDTATWAVLHEEAARLRRLVQDLQDLSRAEAHQIVLHRQPHRPMALIEQAAARIAPQFAEKDVALQVNVPATLPPVQADADRVLQVLINLLGNALRATPPAGSVQVSAALQNEQIVFQVRDTGVGIAPEHLTRLFERFYRVDKARSRQLGGSGIGLTIAKALVEAHGGRMWAASAGLGQGACFSFSLPLATSPSRV